MKLELHTERLLLTPLATTDLDLALELWTDAEVVKYVCDVVTEEEIRQEMPDAEIEIGFFFKPTAWGRGYATEVCKRLLRFAFKEVSLDEVVASVDEENVASKKVLEKSGLINRGRTRSYGKYSPIYRITRDEWNESIMGSDFYE